MMDKTMTSKVQLSLLLTFSGWIATTDSLIVLAQEQHTLASVPQIAELPQDLTTVGSLIQLAPVGDSKRCPVVTAMSLHAESNTLAAAGDDHVIRWIDLKTGETVAILEGHEDWVRQLRFLSTSDGSLVLLSCGDDGKLIRWNWIMEGGKPTITKSSLLQCPHT